MFIKPLYNMRQLPVFLSRDIYSKARFYYLEHFKLRCVHD